MSFLFKFCCCCTDEAEHKSKVEAKKVTTSPKKDEIEDNIVIEQEVVLNEQQDTNNDVIVEPLRKSRRKLPNKKKDVERISIVGAVAALPPPNQEELIGNLKNIDPKDYKGLNLGNGAYLVYNTDDNGTLYIHYSNVVLPSMNGVLAYIKPNKPFSNYHYEDNDGIVILSTNIQNYMASNFQNDRKKYYQAWYEFLSLLTSNDGELYLLLPFNHSPPPKCKLLFYKDCKITNANDMTIVKPTDYQLAGIVPNNFDYEQKLNNDYSKTNFINTCTKYGTILEL